MDSVDIRVRGRVQGVFFRSSAQMKAGKLGISGWVRNCTDGCVEAHACGKREALEAFASWCQSGPERALVDGVETRWGTCEKGCSGFQIRF